jgi:hypothetical protein
MAKVLGRHSRILMPGETHFFDDIYACRHAIGDLRSEASRQRVLEKLSNHYLRYGELPDQERISQIICSRPELWAQFRSRIQTYKDVLDGFMRVQMQVEDKKRWGNNAPRDIFNIAEIRSFYPGAKIVVCVRDPRDFLLSYKGKWKIAEGEHIGRLQKLYHPVVTSLLWKSSMLQLPRIMEQVAPSNRIVIRYEDLVTAPEQTVRRVCDVIEEEFEPQMLDVRESNSSAGSRQSGIFATSIGRWRRELNGAEVAVAQRVTHSQMLSLGYSLETHVSDFVSELLLYATAPFGFARAMRANAQMRGPLIPYLSKRIAALIRRPRVGQEGMSGGDFLDDPVETPVPTERV